MCVLAVLVGGGQGGRVDAAAQVSNLREEDAGVHRQSNKGYQTDEGHRDQNQRLPSFRPIAHFIHPHGVAEAFGIRLYACSWTGFWTKAVIHGSASNMS